MDRRGFLKNMGGAAALNTSSLKELGQDTLEEEENSGKDQTTYFGGGLQEKIEKRKKYREKHGGSTVYLGNVNKDPVNLHGTAENELNYGHSVEELLDDGWSPEGIIRENPEGISLNPNNELKYRVAVQNEIPIDIVQIGRFHAFAKPPEHHADNLENAYSEIPSDEPLEIDINTDIIEPDDETTEQLAKVAGGGETGEKADNFLKNNYSDTGRFSLFMVEDDIDNNSETTGHTDYTANTGYVETQKITHNVDGTTVHETGHGTLRLRHNYLRGGTMSYNPTKNLPIIGNDVTFNDWSKLMAKRFLNGDVECEVVDDRFGKKIDWWYEPAEFSEEDEKKAEAWFQRNLERYLTDKLHYGMGAWDKVNYEQVEKDGKTLDKIKYQYKGTSLHQEFIIDNFIDELKYSQE